MGFIFSILSVLAWIFLGISIFGILGGRDVFGVYSDRADDQPPTRGEIIGPNAGVAVICVLLIVILPGGGSGTVDEMRRMVEEDFPQSWHDSNAYTWLHSESTSGPCVQGCERDPSGWPSTVDREIYWRQVFNVYGRNGETFRGEAWGYALFADGERHWLLIKYDVPALGGVSTVVDNESRLRSRF